MASQYVAQALTLVDDADVSRCGGNEAADLCHKDNQGNLLQVDGLAAAISTRHNMDTADTGLLILSEGIGGCGSCASGQFGVIWLLPTEYEARVN